MGQNSHLVKIETKEENDYIKKQFGGYDSWIGAHDLDSESTFRWVDGSFVDFSDWSPGEPNNNGQNGQKENCAHISKGHSNLWNDASCTNYDMYFICEKENINL